MSKKVVSDVWFCMSSVRAALESDESGRITANVDNGNIKLRESAAAVYNLTEKHLLTGHVRNCYVTSSEKKPIERDWALRKSIADVQGVLNERKKRRTSHENEWDQREKMFKNANLTTPYFHSKQLKGTGGRNASKCLIVIDAESGAESAPLFAEQTRGRGSARAPPAARRPPPAARRPPPTRRARRSPCSLKVFIVSYFVQAERKDGYRFLTVRHYNEKGHS
ncbi:hypothetical protein EVAR_83875_1 [Eumeta japonica]|uniref:Uncharacterized protein n=1 Tax=Eumeta variegata TaxID=151549 RepID=A0A4C1UR93_EUMVA|nr:hypothetical protein EVAR_83875_1 [Eumeta japonica]